MLDSDEAGSDEELVLANHDDTTACPAIGISAACLIQTPEVIEGVTQLSWMFWLIFSLSLVLAFLLGIRINQFVEKLRQLRDPTGQPDWRFGNLPLAAWEEDWSPAYKNVKRRVPEGTTLAAFLTRHPREHRACLDRLAIRGANQAAFRLFGVSDTVEFGAKLKELYASRSGFISELMKGLSTEPHRTEHELARRTETGVFHQLGIHWQVSPELTDTLASVMVSAIDRTADQLTDELLQETMTQVRELTEHSVMGFLVVDFEGLQYANQTMALMLGIPFEDLLCYSLADFLALIHPDDRGILRRRLMTRLSGGQPGEGAFQFRISAADGEIIWLESHTKTISYRGRDAALASMTDVTSRVEAEAVLRLDEERYRLTISHAGVGIANLDLQGEVLDANPQFAEILRRDPERLPGQRLLGFVQAVESTTYAEQFEALLSGKRETLDAELHLAAPDGSEFWVQSTSSLIRNEQAQPQACIMVISEITEHKEALLALKHHEVDLARAQEVAKLGSYAWDLATGTLSWSSELRQIIGCPEEVPSLDLVTSMIHADDRANMMIACEEAIKADERLDVEYRIVRPDGKVRHVRDLAVIERDELGEAIRLWGTLQDVTDQRRLEYEFRTLFSEMLDGCAICELVNENGQPADYSFQAVNPAMERMLSVRAAELVGRTSEFLPAFPREWIDVFSKVGTKGRPAHFPFRTPDGSKHYEISAFRMSEYQFACIIRDLTERRQLEQRLNQSQKMEALGVLAGGIAHDFNNVLFTVLGNADLAQNKLADDHPVQHHLQAIVGGGKRAAELVKQILTFARHQETVRDPLELDRIVKEVTRMVRSSLPANITVQTDIAGKQLLVKADSTEVHQVLMNLCANAGHAMMDGGELTLGLAAESITEPRIEGGQSILPGEYVVLSVSDTGTGIDAEHLERVFEPFFTTKEVGQGTGMGLAVVHGIVSALKGTITLSSVMGKGTSCRIYLPRVFGKAAEPSEVALEPIMGSGRLLVVDDEENIAALMSEMLTRLGYDVKTYSDSLMALAAFRADPDDFDLAVMDQSMPNLTGTQLVEKFQQLRPAFPVIICTGYGEIMTPAEAMEKGIRCYLRKPVDEVKLAEAIFNELNLGASAAGQAAD